MDSSVSLSRRSFVVASLAAFGTPSAFAAAEPVPRLVFGSNMLADYLHVLLYRLPHDHFPPFAPPGFDKVPTLDALVAVPELVASAGLKRYSELEPFVSKVFAQLPAQRSNVHSRGSCPTAMTLRISATSFV
jgi:hypothetical protein